MALTSGQAHVCVCVCVCARARAWVCVVRVCGVCDPFLFCWLVAAWLCVHMAVRGPRGVARDGHRERACPLQLG